MGSFTEDFLVGVAELLVAHSPRVPLTYRAAGAYTAAENPIWMGVAGQEKIRTGVTLWALDTADDPSLSDSELGLTLDFYGTPLQVVRMVDDAFDVLHGLWGATIGGVKVQFCNRVSGAKLGQDEAGNLRQTENYSLAVHRPSPNRT